MDRRHDNDPSRPPSVDTRDFAAIFRREFDAVWRVARTLAGAEAADDVTQEAFIVAHRNFARFSGGSVRAWLFAIVRNVARNAVRASSRRVRNLAALQGPDAARRPDEQAELDEATRRLDAFAASLPEAQREVFVLMDLEGLTAPTLAEMFGVPVQTVYSRRRAAHLALARFTADLDREGRR